VSDRLIRCRYLDRLGNRCSGEATEPDAPLVLCQRHLAAGIETIRDLATKYPGLLTPKENS
jgi:hypothetical protein